jgi:hypothetical protein
MKQGDVFHLILDNGPKLCHVLNFDRHQVLYDEWMQHWKGSEDWSSRFARRHIQTRMGRPFFDANCKFLNRNEFSAKEEVANPSNLPLMMARLPKWIWGTAANLEYEEFCKLLRKQGVDLDPFIDVTVSTIGLTPLKPDGREIRAPVIYESSAASGFDVTEVFWLANRLQPELVDVKGCGIFRAGTKNQVPTFYMWGFIDRAGFLERTLEN